MYNSISQLKANANTKEDRELNIIMTESVQIMYHFGVHWSHRIPLRGASIRALSFENTALDEKPLLVQRLHNYIICHRLRWVFWRIIIHHRTNIGLGACRSGRGIPDGTLGTACRGIALRLNPHRRHPLLFGCRSSRTTIMTGSLKNATRIRHYHDHMNHCFKRVLRYLF